MPHSVPCQVGTNPARAITTFMVHLAGVEPALCLVRSEDDYPIADRWTTHAAGNSLYQRTPLGTQQLRYALQIYGRGGEF